jgi:hypothetical protein
LGFWTSAGILDELYAKLLVFESESNKVAIVTTDLIGFQTEYADNIRCGIAENGSVDNDVRVIFDPINFSISIIRWFYDSRIIKIRRHR